MSVGSLQSPVGFLTDTTLCIGCKACEVACKQWNQLPMDGLTWTGNSYDNTGDLGAYTWRHVEFIERFQEDIPRASDMPPFQSHWLMMSDVCKHCAVAGCLEACPTGAIIRTEFGTVYIQPDICNGCGYCVPACPFGVPDIGAYDGISHKCTLCYDRLKDGLEPACAKACPTDSIQFGSYIELKERARRRVEHLHSLGVTSAYIYGDENFGGTNGIQGLYAMFILTDEPEVYNLPRRPELPQRKVLRGYLSGLLFSILMMVLTALSLKRRD